MNGVKPFSNDPNFEEKKKKGYKLIADPILHKKDQKTYRCKAIIPAMSSSKPSGSKTKRKIADEYRNFQEKWELEYFCSEVRDKIICLICNNAIMYQNYITLNVL
ncbi:hypothetical protein LAZ67_3004917 [Cordylochernes scorpioides]|uniref:Bromo domain-containing protein n=1 Tax=Cordylochernes scorpioides TaxID=51811 RepID=A0ABY6KA84_9ARAC|nr:hypothetical protein LAZ67_3004917 [Cordylochernes scorpioides]